MINLAIVLGIIGVIGYCWYATLIRRRNKVLESLGSINVQLVKRHDLIPNILAIAKKFMEHESSLLQEVTALRAQAESVRASMDPVQAKELFAIENQLQGKFQQFLALAENYPTLKSDGPMLQAQQTYNEVEEHIAAARRFYNSAVGSLNNALQIFPGNLLAAMAGITAYPFYEAQAAQTIPVSALNHL